MIQLIHQTLSTLLSHHATRMITTMATLAITLEPLVQLDSKVPPVNRVDPEILVPQVHQVPQDLKEKEEMMVHPEHLDKMVDLAHQDSGVNLAEMVLMGRVEKVEKQVREELQVLKEMQVLQEQMVSMEGTVLQELQETEEHQVPLD